jgi:hypothetical protein
MAALPHPQRALGNAGPCHDLANAEARHAQLPSDVLYRLALYRCMGSRQVLRNQAEEALMSTIEQSGVLEKVGDAIGAPDQRVKGDLQRFKEMIESRGRESGAWRGQVDRPDEP